MGNVFVRPHKHQTFVHSRTYDRFIPKSNCESFTIDAMIPNNIAKISRLLRSSKHIEIYIHRRSIMRCIKMAIIENPDIRDVGYILFRTQRSVILKIDNKEVHPLFDRIGQKWFYLDYNIE